MKNKSCFPVLIIFIGMILTFLFFTLFVFVSNRHLYQNTLQIVQAGYLAVPNAYILPSLKNLSTALKGAVFFTLTLGIVFPALVYSAAWAWDRGYHRNKAFLIILSGLVIFCMVMINRYGFNPIVSFWFLTVYFIIFKLTLLNLEYLPTGLSIKRILTHILVLAAIGAIWISAPSGIDFFKAVRDHIFLSNSLGKKITNFYYQISPYPTEACKSLYKKQIKTCFIQGAPKDEISKRIKSVLIRYDYLPIDTHEATDVVLVLSGDHISFGAAGRTVLRSNTADFLKSPGTVLYRLSRRCDRQEFTRRLLAFSIKYGLPLFLYACLFTFFQCSIGRILGGLTGFFTSAAGCLAVGLAAMILFKIFAPTSVPVSQLKDALQSDNPDLRVAALRTVSIQGLDPLNYAAPGGISKDRPYIAERIWWAKSLANSAQPDANKALLQLVDDPYPIVACMAYDALRVKGYRSAVNLILQKIKTSRHWYVQGYAYQTLRSLGWKQNLSN